MEHMTADPAAIKRLVTWGESHSDIKTMLLCRSRVDPKDPVDPF